MGSSRSGTCSWSWWKIFCWLSSSLVMRRSLICLLSIVGKTISTLCEVAKNLRASAGEYSEALRCSRCFSVTSSAIDVTPQDILLSRQTEIQAERDRKLEPARYLRQLRRQHAATFADTATATTNAFTRGNGGGFCGDGTMLRDRCGGG